MGRGVENPPPSQGEGPVAYPPAATKYPPPPPETTDYPPAHGPVAFPPPPAEYPPPSGPCPPKRTAACTPEGPVAFPPKPAQYPAAQPAPYPSPSAPSKPPPPPFQQQLPQYQARKAQTAPYPSPPPGPPQPRRPIAPPPVYGYPAQQQMQEAGPRGYQQQYLEGEPWTTELFACLDDPNNAIITYFAPCVTFGQIAEIIDEGRQPCSSSALMYALILGIIYSPFIYSCTYRTRLRQKYNLMESPFPDWLVHFLCEPCALCQEYRELKNRGIDPAFGWQAVISGPPQVATAPPTRQYMHQ